VTIVIRDNQYKIFILKSHLLLRHYFRIFAALFSLFESHVYPDKTKSPTKIQITPI